MEDTITSSTNNTTISSIVNTDADFNKEINGLVFVKGSKTFTDSLMVARVFEKEHWNVIRDIKTLDCSEEFNAINFEGVTYTDKKGETRPKYNMTRDGFTFLAMGYTGKKAAQFKEAYINAFNRMEEHIRAAQNEKALQLTRKAMMQAIETGNWINNRMNAYGVTNEQLATYYFFRMNWLTKKEAGKAFDLSRTVMDVFDQILKKQGHHLPTVKMNKRDKALRRLHTSSTLNSLASRPAFPYFTEEAA